MITSRLPKTYAKKKLCQYPAILTSRLVNDAFLFHYRRQQKNSYNLNKTSFTMYPTGKIQPRGLPLSDVMATSAAVLALYMGVYDVKTEAVRNLQMVLGVHSGKSLISDPDRDVAGSTISCCRVSFFCPNKEIWIIDFM